ncbi:MAG: RNase adapter RapZ [Ruminococcus sp.]|nr:RNase adapter RapZ [Ruminococcus sp.]
MEFVIITGLSGAGKTCALHALEDIGFYCVDNLPTTLLKTFYNLCETSTDNAMKRVAVVIDVRGGKNLNTLYNDIMSFKEEHKPFSLLFLDAKENVLVTRFKETRRRHPLADVVLDNSIESALDLEVSYLAPFKKIADYTIDTTNVSVKLLKERITEIFLGNSEKGIIISFMSFGFKHGAPNDCDTIFDARCLPNPYYIPELREKTGLDKDVYDYVFSCEETGEFVKRMTDFLDYSVPLYRKEGKAELVVGIGCTGGQHRSVAIAETLKNHFFELGYKTSVFHRDAKKRTN